MDKDDNTVFKDMAKRWHERGTKFSPAVTVNEVIIRG